MSRSSVVVISLLAAACGGGSGAGTTSATNAQSAAPAAFKGEDCHATFHDGSMEKQVIDFICASAAPSGDDVSARLLRTDDRRFDANAAGLLVDQCVESGKCASAEEIAGLVAWYAPELTEQTLSASTKKLEVSPQARDAFADRTLANVAKLDKFLATLTPAQRQYLVDLPKSVHDGRAGYYKSRTDDYAKLDRVLEKLDRASAKNVDAAIIPTLVTMRSDAATQCGDAKRCGTDPMYLEVSRALLHAYVLAELPFEAKTSVAILGFTHGGRGTAASQIWASQTAYRKLHPEVKAPVAVTEEMSDPTTALVATGIEIVRGDVAAISGTKMTFKPQAAGKRCEESADIEGFDGAIEQTRVLYKQVCTDVAAGAAIAAVTVTPSEVTNIKPGATVIASVMTSGTTRKAAIVRVLAGDKIVQLGPDKFTATSGDPLKGQ